MIISLIGFKGSGKDTVGSYLESEYGFSTLSFADPLKDALSSIFLWDRELLDGKTPESRLWREQTDKWWSEKLEISNFSPRKALQMVGTDVMRKYINDDIWIYNLEKKIQILLEDNKRNIVVQDCRFPNEIIMTKKYGSIPIRISRGKDPTWMDTAISLNLNESWKSIPHDELFKIIPEHPSEWAWIGTEINNNLYNNGSIPELLSQVDSFIKEN